MKHKRLVVSVVIVVFIAIAGTGLHQWREHHLSAGFRQTLTACFSENASESDARLFAYNARLAVRTKRDAEVDAKFEMSQRLSKLADEEHANSDRLELNAAFETGAHEFKLASEDSGSAKSCQKDEQRDRRNARNLMNEVRSEIGLPSMS